MASFPEETRTVIIRGGLVVVAGFRIIAAGHFQLIAHAVLVGVVEAVAVAVVELIGVDADEVVFGGLVVVVAGQWIGAAEDFELVAHAVLIGVVEAGAFAVVELFGVDARGVVLGGFGVVVAGHLVGTTRQRGDVQLEHKHAVLDVAHHNVSAGEVGVVAPSSGKARGIGAGDDVEERQLAEVAGSHIRDVQDAQATAVVALVQQVAQHVVVVVNGGVVRNVSVQVEGVVQILHIEDEGGGVDPVVELVGFVVAHEEAVVFGQPALVHVAHVVVSHLADLLHVGGVRHVHNGDVVRVATKRDLFALVVGVRTVVDHHLRIVGVARLFPGAQNGGVERVVDVDHVQTTACSVGAHANGVTGFLVDHNVVRTPESVVVGVGLKLGGDDQQGVHQLGEVHDLHAMSREFADHKDVVVEHLGVAPGVVAFDERGQSTQVHRIQRIGHFHEGRARAQAQDGKFTPAFWIHPTPDVVGARGAAQVFQGDEGHQVDVLTRVDVRKARFTGSLGKEGRSAYQRQQGQKSSHASRLHARYHNQGCLISRWVP